MYGFKDAVPLFALLKRGLELQPEQHGLEAFQELKPVGDQLRGADDLCERRSLKKLRQFLALLLRKLQDFRQDQLQVFRAALDGLAEHSQLESAGAVFGCLDFRQRGGHADGDDIEDLPLDFLDGRLGLLLVGIDVFVLPSLDVVLDLLGSTGAEMVAQLVARFLDGGVERGTISAISSMLSSLSCVMYGDRR